MIGGIDMRTLKDIAIGTFTGILLTVFVFAMIVDASPRYGWSGDRYIHKTKSAMYDRGEPTRNAYRWRGNKLYYIGHNGRILRHSTKYIKLNRDDSVKYIYTPGTNHNERWNAKERRYQKRRKNGHWLTFGMQTNLWWMCDLQE